MTSLTQPGTSLAWPGKRLDVPRQPVAVHLAETFEPGRGHSRQGAAHVPDLIVPVPNAIVHGDNLAILAGLLEAGHGGRARMIYADPPYDSGVDWTRKVRLRGPREAGTPTIVEQQTQYRDTWDAGAYLQFMYVRLWLLRQLLAEDGSLWLHCDHRRAHHLRCVLDEIFGDKNYLNTITWRSQTARGAKVNAFYFPNSAHTILVYAKNRAAPTCWNPPKKSYILTETEAAAEFMRDEHGFFRTSDPGTYSFESLLRLHAEGRLYAPFGGAVVVDEATRRIYGSNGGNIGVKYYLTQLGNGRHGVERAVDNIWDDIPGLGTTPGEDLGYPTQKTEALLERVITTATQPGDWVIDPFAGSGTTLAVAQKLGRRWIGCDAAMGAIQTTTRRLYATMQGQVSGAPHHASVTFAVYRSDETRRLADPGAPQMDLSITRIDGQEARIRIVVEQVTWPPDAGVVCSDWRTAVDSIAIDPAYDGHVLRVALADAPLKKTLLVTGIYTMAAPAYPTTIAVRVTDVWGRETIVTHKV